MFHLTEISTELSEDTVLYRTVDFFTAMAMLKDKELMFSRADTFIDRNEGVDMLLTQLALAGPLDGCSMGWNNAETGQAEHERMKRSYYISSWSLTRESIAIWSLYSIDNCSVRISSSVKKLKTAVERLEAKYSHTGLGRTEIGKRVAVASEARIAPVTYSSIADLSRRISRRVRARRRLAERLSRKGMEYKMPSDFGHPYWRREQLRAISETSRGCSLKDSSFAHEREVRLAVRINEITLSEAHWVNLDHCTTAIAKEDAPYRKILRDYLSAYDGPPAIKLPPREFVPIDDGLIESVAIDPRCPEHKARFMRDSFKAHGVPIVTSSCFGYLPDSFDVFPMR